MDQQKVAEKLMKMQQKFDKSKNINPSFTREGSDRRYPALRTISGILVFWAILEGIAAIGLAYYFFSASLTEFGIISIITGGVLVLVTVALSEGIKVIIDIEYNTRVSSKQ